MYASLYFTISVFSELQDYIAILNLYLAIQFISHSFYIFLWILSLLVTFTMSHNSDSSSINFDLYSEKSVYCEI